jgi:ankyrin repeat protein
MKWSYEGDITKIDSVLRLGMNPDTTSNKGWTALKVAVKAGKTEVVQLLLNSNADPNLPDDVKMTPLMEACISNNYSIAKLLIENGANVNASLDNGWTALMGATSYGDVRLMQLLIDNNANVNAIRTTDSFTALSLAQYHKAEDKINLLRKFGGR